MSLDKIGASPAKGERDTERYLKISMKTQQINLKLPVRMIKEARKYAEIYGYRSLQELAADALREKIFEREEFDETFTDDEIRLIDEIIEKSVRRRKIKTEEDLKKAVE